MWGVAKWSCMQLGPCHGGFMYRHPNSQRIWFGLLTVFLSCSVSSPVTPRDLMLCLNDPHASPPPLIPPHASTCTNKKQTHQ